MDWFRTSTAELATVPRLKYSRNPVVCWTKRTKYSTHLSAIRCESRVRTGVVNLREAGLGGDGSSGFLHRKRSNPRAPEDLFSRGACVGHGHTEAFRRRDALQKRRRRRYAQARTPPKAPVRSRYYFRP